jgi:membrane protein YdbS with pleckstrin-like domain
MYEPLRRRALALLKVPPEPHPPMGDPSSLRVFHAGRNYYRLRITVWGVAQVLGLAGLLFWTAILIEVETAALAKKPAPTVIPAEPAKAANPAGTTADENRRREQWANQFAEKVKLVAASAERTAKTAGQGGFTKGWAAYKQVLLEIGELLPAWAFPLIWGLKILSFAIYFLQLPITYAVRRLDYEMRWYLVTDRSLRLRHGIWNVSESTMSFANIQQVLVNQGPVQRLLGLADVKVQSAGGGGSGSDQLHQEGKDMHLGLFHSVTNAPEIRDLILERLRRFRESGLGDPDDSSLPAAMAPETGPADTLAAARELQAEARALRAALT